MPVVTARGRAVEAESGTRGKKISVDIPISLYREAEEVIEERHITKSIFVREAIERYLKSIKRKKLERELAAGYTANAELDRQICSEFEYVDAEQA